MITARPGGARRGLAGLGGVRRGTARQGKARRFFSTAALRRTRGNQWEVIMVTTRKSETAIAAITRSVVLKGIRPIMFDRYAGDNQTKLLWYQKIYQIPGSMILALPTANVVSFLSSHNTNSAPKRLRDARQYKKIANACLSFTMIEGPPEHPDFIPFTRDGETITVGTIDGDRDETSGLYCHRSVARLEKGIPNPKERAVLPMPWELPFTITIASNKEIKEQEIRNLFDEGGIAIGFGTFRGVYGKFMIDKWK